MKDQVTEIEERLGDIEVSTQRQVEQATQKAGLATEALKNVRRTYGERRRIWGINGLR